VNTIGQAMRELRVSLRMTREEAGALVHASAKRWGQWEAGDDPFPKAEADLFQLKVAGLAPHPDRYVDARGSVRNKAIDTGVN
jgi:DNA-binding XRE family transcriptional regulator